MTHKPAFDPGLTNQFGAPLSRTINRDGSFNVRRTGVRWSAFHPWLYVVNMSWKGFSGVVLAVYMTVNITFALWFYAMGAKAVAGAEAPTKAGRFLNCFFFSSHTLSTVGYGTLAPRTVAANIASTCEALVGLLSFALITGLLVARASRPSARIEYSAHALIAPYQSGRALMFRIANQRSNNLMELTARVMLMQVTGSPASGKAERKFTNLTLERDALLMFPLTWTVVHPIDEASPLFGKTAEELESVQAEVLVLVKGFDETFSQTVHSRFSYRADEIVWDAKFLPAFRVEPDGDLLLELDKVGDFAQA